MKTFLRIAVISTALFPLAFAQDKGAPITGSGGSSIGAILPIAFYGNTVTNPVVGPDGNAYLIRTSLPTTAPFTTKTELVSVGAAANTGKVNWTLQIDGTFVSAPAFGSSLIFLTTSEPVVLPLAATGASPVAAKQPSLLIIQPGTTSASILHTVTIAANTLSAPQVSSDGQTIYVLAQTSPVFTFTATNSFTPASATLYAYSTAGTLKNSVKLY